MQGLVGDGPQGRERMLVVRFLGDELLHVRDSASEDHICRLVHQPVSGDCIAEYVGPAPVDYR